MQSAVLVVILLAYASAFDSNAAASFADANWNCVTAACTSRVTSGTFQSQYQCAEFVSRSLAAGGGIPGLNGNSPQSAFLTHRVNGKTYDLLWVSSVQGLPYGMEDYLQDMGWKNIGTDCTKVRAGHAVITTGSDGPHSHTIVGVGNQLADAHNAAHLHTNPCFYTVEAIYEAPGGSTPTPPPPPPAGCVGIYQTTTDLNLRSSPSTTGTILQTIPSGSTVYDISGTTIAANGFNWRNIEFNGQKGYSADSFLTKTGTCTAPQSYCITASPNLRLRSSPCTTGTAITSMPKGASVTSLSSTLTAACGYNWRHVDFNGNQGYAANEFLVQCTPLGQFFDGNATIDPGACTTYPGAGAVTSFSSLLVIASVVVAMLAL